VIWRGPKKNGLIKSFLKDVYWSDLDVLVFDTPPGTSDEHITVTQCLKDVGIDGAVLVTTPQAVACADVRREITFCRKVGIRILGLVENMSGYVCRKCGTETAVFRATEGGGEALAKETGVPFLGRVALDPALMRACDAGQTNYLQACRDSPTAHALNDICNQVARTIGLDV
jgi:Mrp family chromosome partitioning ATPase